MNFYQLKTPNPKTPYAPFVDVSLGHKVLQIDCNILTKLLLDKEPEVLQLPVSTDANGNFTDGGTGTGRDSITARFQNFNILSWKYELQIRNLQYQIKDAIEEYNGHFGNRTPDKLYINCWYNVLRRGGQIRPHLHSCHEYSYLSGHVTVQSDDTCTGYINPVNIKEFFLSIVKPTGLRELVESGNTYEIDNNVGELTIFPTRLAHYTSVHESDIPRITIAFDVNYQPITATSILL